VRLVPESVLGLRLLKRGYIAQYAYGKAFIVAETSPETAAEVMRKLRARVGETAAVKIATRPSRPPTATGPAVLLPQGPLHRRFRRLGGRPARPPAERGPGGADSIASL